MDKKAQAWGFDLMVAIVIFISGILIFYLYSINASGKPQENIESMLFDGNFITDSLLFVGLPNDWTESTVLSIGLTNNNKINNTKLERFYNMANPITNQEGYQRSRLLFSTKFEYFMNFTKTTMTINSIDVQGIGNWSSTPPKNLFKISRVTIYKNKPVTLDLYIWN